jgi:hypothetical protein
MVESTVSILVASTRPIEPTLVMVEVATFHTAAGSALMDAPSEVEAVSTVAFVLAFMTDAREDVAVSIWLLVFALTTDATDEDAVVTSERVARLPDVSPAPVKVRVAAPHMSEVSVPNDERVRTDAFHTLRGIEVARDEEAVRTAVFVFVFTSLTIPAVALVVLALTSATTEDEAVAMVVLRSQS